MECLAKIVHEQKGKRFWKYKFVDLKTNEDGFFYHSKKLNYISIFAGRLKLAFDEEQKTNFLQSFEQDIDSYLELKRH